MLDRLIPVVEFHQNLREHRPITAGVVADAFALPFRRSSFDLVTANMLLEHLSDPRPAFDEIARVLRPGGEFIFPTPNRRHPAVWLAAIILPSKWRSVLTRLFEGREERDLFPTHYRANTMPRIARLARNAGFDVSAVDVFSSYPFAKRPAALVVLEAYWIRLVQRGPMRVFGSNIVGRLVKSRTARDGGGNAAQSKLDADRTSSAPSDASSGPRPV